MVWVTPAENAADAAFAGHVKYTATAENALRAMRTRTASHPSRTVGVAACTSRAQSAIIPRAGYAGAAQMRELLFCIHTALAAVFLIGGVALAIESWFGGWGLGLMLALATVNWVVFVILAMLFAATAIHLRRSGLT